ncbi:hypothetical protein M501DRAFT_942243 [Patellaria atrata CBS 101060]|uniref:Clr5 domain-containing protein n=1 Tax=Patellaria atrata CBS 101060 TaxID=1346257 RepID=A0A9P4VML4_9PEZI|nr:hypothetical protein M501DRAFT_942243 [Patellaria atrata CBS 101060]
MSSPYVAQQAHRPHDVPLAFDSTLQTQGQGGQFMTGQSHIPYSFHDYPLQNGGSFGDSQTGPVIPMGPPTRPRKRKAPTLHANAWEPYKDRIVELYIEQRLSLKEVKKKIENEFGFIAELRQYRTRVSQWGKDKNIKPTEMKTIVRKQQRRKLVEVTKGELITEVRGNKVEQRKIDRWMKRKGVSKSLLYSPSPAASTPSDVYCRTISECDSLAHSPVSSVATPILSTQDIISIAGSPQMFSPAPSITSIIQPQSSTFTGQSSASTYLSLPSSLPYPISTPNAFQGQIDSAAALLPQRYKQREEERLREELSRAENWFGTSHSKHLGILSILGEVFISQGRYKSAEEVIRRLVEDRRTIGGNDDIDTLAAIELLGLVLEAQGLYTKAEKLHRRTFESRKIILGDEHPDTLSSTANLASTYRNQGRWKEAEELEVQVMEKRKRVLGEEHPDTLISMVNLALTYSTQGRWKEAEELEVQVMEKRMRVLGRDIYTP